MNIYFGDTLLNSDSIMALSYEASLFDGNFTLGSTVCKVVHLDVAKEAVTAIPTSVLVVDEVTPSAMTLQVDSWELNDEGYYSFTLTDAMVNFNVVYDWSELADQSLQNILDNMCTDLIGSTAPTIAYMGDLELTWNQNTQARDVISYIAEVNGSFARINEYGELVFVPFTDTPVDSIDVDTCEDFSHGEEIVIDRVVYESGVATSKYPDDESYTGTHSTLYLNPDNFLLTDSQGYTRDGIVQHIYSLVNGLYFYPLETNRCEINSSVQAGDCIEFTLGNESYKTFAQIDWDFNGSWYGGYKLDVQSKKQEETAVGGVTASIDRRVTIVVDRELGAIQQEIDELSTDVENSIATITYLYGYGTSATTHPADSAFTHSTMPPLVEGTYIWRKTTFTENNGDETYQYEMIQGVGEDGTGVSELEELHYLQTPQPKELSGNVVTVEDSVITRPLSLVTEYTPNQDLNGQSFPWEGGSSINLCENVIAPNTTITRNGVTAVFQNDGSFILNGTTTTATLIAYNFALDGGGTTSTQNDQKKHLPNGTYTIRSFASNCNMQICASNTSGTASVTTVFQGTNGTYTVDDQYAYNWVRILISSGKTFSNVVVKPMIVLSTDDSSVYIPYRNYCPILPTTTEVYHNAKQNLFNYTLEDIKSAYPDSTGVRSWNGNVCTYRGIDITFGDDGVITLNGTMTGTTSISMEIPIPTYLDGDYIFAGSFSTTGSGTTFQAYARDNTANARIKKWNGTSNSDYMRSHGGYQIKLVKGHNNVIRIIIYENANISNVTFSPMIKPKEDTSYSPYYPKGVEEVTEYNFGAVYGGTVDEASGTITHKMKMVDMGDLGWSYNSASGAFNYNLSDRKTAQTSMISSLFECVEITSSAEILSGADLKVYFNRSNNKQVFMKATSFGEDVDALKTYLSGISLVYELDEETTEQAPAGGLRLAVGELNNVVAENSDITLTYAYDKTVDPPVAKVVTVDRYPDIWTLSFPDYVENSRYWYCLQITYTDNSLAWSTPILDYSSTGTQENIEYIADTVSNLRVETSANMEILSDRISSLVSRTETIEENYINEESLENTLVSKQYVTSSELTQTADNITATFGSYVRKDDKEYVDLTTNIVFDADGINISSSNIETNLQLSADGVSIQDSSNNVITSMTPTEFTTGDWVMNQSNYVFSIFRRHN